MRIIQILYSGLGGHGGVAFALVDGDRHQKWTWSMGFLGVEPLLPDYATACNDRKVGHRYFRAEAGKPWCAWPAILCWLNRERPDAILLHSVSAVIPCALYAKARRKPLIVIEHQQNALKTGGEWLASRWAMALADQVVVLTPGYAADLREGLGRWFQDRKVAVIPNGVATNVFKPGRTRVRGGVRMGMAARFSHNKRFDQLIDMMGCLRLRRPRTEWKLSLAGSGERLDYVRNQIRAAGLEDLIELPGMLPARELAEWYRTLDIYVHATDGETLSVSILQAMASAVPVIASNAPGVSDLLCGGGQQLGILVDGSTGEGFSDAVIAATEDWAMADIMAERALKEVLEIYGSEAMFTRYSDVLAWTVTPS